MITIYEVMVTLLSVLPSIFIIIKDTDQTDADNNVKICPLLIEE